VTDPRTTSSYVPWMAPSSSAAVSCVRTEQHECKDTRSKAGKQLREKPEIE
jgi:hypothetical protein